MGGRLTYGAPQKLFEAAISKNDFSQKDKIVSRKKIIFSTRLKHRAGEDSPRFFIPMFLCRVQRQAPAVVSGHGVLFLTSIPRVLPN